MPTAGHRSPAQPSAQESHCTRNRLQHRPEIGNPVHEHGHVSATDGMLAGSRSGWSGAPSRTAPPPALHHTGPARLSRPPAGLGLDWPEHGGILDRIGAGGARHIIGKFKPVALGEIHAAGDTRRHISADPDSHSHLREVFALNLRRLRHAKGLSQDDLAYEAEVNRSYLSQLEKGVLCQPQDRRQACRCIGR
jgi:DNA-binding XRE family transcriptional regulator